MSILFLILLIVSGTLIYRKTGDGFAAFLGGGIAATLCYSLILATL